MAERYFKSLDNRSLPVVLTRAGFRMEEVANIVVYSDQRYFDNVAFTEPKASQEFFGLVGELLDPAVDMLAPQARTNFLKLALTGRLFGSGFDDPKKLERAEFITKAINRQPGMSRLKRDFRSLLMSTFYMDFPGEEMAQKHLHFGLNVLTDPDLYRVFDNEVRRVTFFLTGYPKDHRGIDIGMVAHHIAFSPYGKLLLKGKTPDFFARARYALALPEIVANRQLATLFSDFMIKERSWAEKYDFLGKAFAVSGLPVVSARDMENYLVAKHFEKNFKGSRWTSKELVAGYQRLDPEKKAGLVYMLAREQKKGRKMTVFLNEVKKAIKKPEDQSAKIREMEFEESPWNPVVSLIAKTNGNEIEFPKFPENEDFPERLAASIGFKKGDGGDKYTETSPGPYFSPKTAVYVFGRFADAGIIDMINQADMSMHYNAGITDDGAIPFVRAFQLTGACLNTKRQLSKANAGINKKSTDDLQEIHYTEFKSFANVTRWETEWMLEKMGYMTYAIGAKQDLDSKAVIPAGYVWKNKLRGIWLAYLNTLDHGLASTGFLNFLHSGDSGSEYVKLGIEQLRAIFSVPGARMGGLRDIGRKDNPMIEPVRLNGEIFNNVAYFSRVMADRYSSEVVKVAESIIEEAKYDIRRIERVPKSKKGVEILGFILKYNYGKAMWNENVTDEYQAFERVKKVLGF
jgi:hypothetical protein